MGREVRRVPPNYEHPRTTEGRDAGQYRPMHDRRFEDAAQEWKEGYSKWEAGLRPQYTAAGDEWVRKDRWAYAAEYPTDLQFWEYSSGPPKDREDYRTYSDAEATWFQVYETVSEGTPVTPPFATAEELVDYLAARGDFWDQRRGSGGWDRAAAERFVKAGSAPSLIVRSDKTGVEFLEPRDYGS